MLSKYAPSSPPSLVAYRKDELTDSKESKLNPYPLEPFKDVFRDTVGLVKGGMFRGSGRTKNWVSQDVGKARRSLEGYIGTFREECECIMFTTWDNDCHTVEKNN
jgi:hypothetical protein